MWLILSLLACNGAETPSPPDSEAPADTAPPSLEGHLQIEPAFVFLQPGEEWTLVATIDGVEVEAEFESSAPDGVAMDGATVAGQSGAALITARFDGKTSTPATVIVGEVNAGSVFVSDAQIIGKAIPVDDTQPYEPGVLFDLELQDVEAEPGDILLARETFPLAARLVSWDGETARLEALPPEDFVESLSFELDIPLGQLEPDLSGWPGYEATWDTDGSLTLTPGDRSPNAFSCSAGLTLTPATSGITIKNELYLRTTWDGVAPERVILDGQFTLDVGYTVGIVELEAAAECNYMTARKYAFKGFFSIFPQPATEIGFGAQAAVTEKIYDSGTELKMRALVKPELGYDCQTEPCTFHTTWESEVSITEPKVTAPGWATPQTPVELSLDNYTIGRLLFASSIGEEMSEFSPDIVTHFTLMDAQGGTRLKATLQTEEVQAARSDYRANYWFGGFSETAMIPVGVEFLDGLFEVDLIDISWEYEVHLDNSPHGSFTTNEDSFEPGEPVTFDIALDEVVFLDSLDFVDVVNWPWEVTPPRFYNVSEIVIQRIELDEETGEVLGLTEETRLPATEDQQSWEWTWTPTEDDAGTVHFAAFVDTVLIPGLDMEVSDNSIITLSSCSDEVVNGDMESGPNPWLAFYNNANVSNGWSLSGLPISAHQGTGMLNVGWDEGASTVGGLGYQVIDELPAGDYTLEFYSKVSTDTHNVDFSGSCADKIPKLFIAVGEYTVTSFAEFDFDASELYCDRITERSDAYQVASTNWRLHSLPVTVPYDVPEGILMFQVYDGYSQWAHWVSFDDIRLLGECE